MKLFCVLVSLILVNVKADSESDYKEQVQITNFYLEKLDHNGFCEIQVDDLIEEVIHSYRILFSRVDTHSTVEEKKHSYIYVDGLVEELIHLYNTPFSKVDSSGSSSSRVEEKIHSYMPLVLMLIEPELPVYDKGGRYPKFEELIENETRLQTKIRRKLANTRNDKTNPSNIDPNEKDWGDLAWDRRRITCTSLTRLTDEIEELEEMHWIHKTYGYRLDPRFMTGRRIFNPQEIAFLKWQKEYKPTAKQEVVIYHKNVEANSESDYKFQVQLTNHLFQELLDKNGIVDDILADLINAYTSFIQLALMLIAPENPAYDKDGDYPKTEDLVDNEKLFQNVIRRKLGKNTNDKPSKIELNEEDWGSLGRRRRLITLSSIQRLIDDGQTKRRVFREHANDFLKWQSLYFPISKRDVKVDENDNSPVIET